jgi:hypothetical protein
VALNRTRLAAMGVASSRNALAVVASAEEMMNARLSIEGPVFCEVVCIQKTETGTAGSLALKASFKGLERSTVQRHVSIVELFIY